LRLLASLGIQEDARSTPDELFAEPVVRAMPDQVKGRHRAGFSELHGA
jgi:hypothetical protein